MTVNMDGPDSLIEDVLNIPVEDLQTLLVAVHERLRPLVNLIGGAAPGTPQSRDDNAMFDVLLVGVNKDKKIQSIKAVREASAVAGRTALGLKESKDMFDNVIANGRAYWVRTRLLIEEAEECVRILAREGCTGTIQPSN